LNGKSEKPEIGENGNAVKRTFLRIGFRFRREEHLKGRKEIREVFEKGKRYGCQGAKLYVLENNLTYNRICFTFSKPKKISKGKRVSWTAVSRNREKRLGRESFRLMKDRLAVGYNLVLLVYPDSITGKYAENPEITGKKAIKGSLSEKSRQLESLFLKAGLLK